MFLKFCSQTHLDHQFGPPWWFDALKSVPVKHLGHFRNALKWLFWGKWINSDNLLIHPHHCELNRLVAIVSFTIQTIGYCCSTHTNIAGKNDKLLYAGKTCIAGICQLLSWTGTLYAMSSHQGLGILATFGDFIHLNNLQDHNIAGIGHPWTLQSKQHTRPNVYSGFKIFPFVEVSRGNMFPVPRLQLAPRGLANNS